MNRKNLAYLFLGLICSSTVLPALSAPSSEEGRKFNVKPNNPKKIYHKQSNSIDEPVGGGVGGGGGFSWGSLLQSMLQVFFSPVGVASDKADGGVGPLQSGGAFSWGNLLSIGLRVLLAALSGGNGAGGIGANDANIDKVDSSSAMQGILTAVFSAMMGGDDPNQVATMAKQAGELINLVVALLDALKTSFSQRALHARSLGEKDSMADAALATIAMLKGYARTYGSQDDICYQRHVCQANQECAQETTQNGYVFCQFATYGAAYLLERSTSTPVEIYNDAGRRGRAGENCTEIYKSCNEI